MAKYYVTTPIFYINDIPHVGHAYTMLAAATVVRYRSLLGDTTFFLTGTDENSQKTLAKAQELGKEPMQFADEMAKKWAAAWAALGIKPDRFIRTTETDHQKTVVTLLSTVSETGDIYKGTYEGPYCVGCEEFKNEKDLLDGRVCPLHRTPCQEISEENYFFRLSKYRDRLIEYIEKHPEFIQPESRKNEALGFLRQELKDISISRPNRGWGIPLPFDADHVAYVWFDALLNYVTGAGYGAEQFQKLWPPDLQLVGKDIIKFHAIIWPALLLALDFPLPKTVFAHGFFTIDGQKISKSLGNAIDPIKLAEKYGAPALAYYLLAGIPFGGDGDFSEEALRMQYNADLADTYGNAIQRIVALAGRKNIKLTVPKEDFTSVVTRHPVYSEAMDQFRFSDAITYARDIVIRVNQDINRTTPWKVEDQGQLTVLLNEWAVSLTEASHLLEPFLSDKARQARDILSGIRPSEILFPKIQAA